MGTSTLLIAGAHKTYAGRSMPVFDGLDLNIDTGEFLVVLGMSGSGKSSLMRVIAGLETLDAGTISWNGIDDGARPRVGMVFQQPLLMPWLTVRENVVLGGRFAANNEGFDESFAYDLISRFGLAVVADAFPDQLSGGQAQRVAVIRAVAIRPQLMLLDEPFSALDPAIRADLERWLEGVARDLDFTTVLVTHDVDEAIMLGHRIALLGTSGRVQRQWDRSQKDVDRETLRSDILAQYRDIEPVGASKL